MDHNLVIEKNTAERYLLGELDDAERDAYEEHYFECPECAQELLCGSEFMVYAREVEREMASEQGLHKVTAIFARTPWLRPLAMAACGVLAVGLALGSYKVVVTQSAMKDRAGAQIVAVSVVLNPSRSAEDPALPANKAVRLKFVIPPGHFKSYHAVIVGPSPSNVERFPREINAEDAKSAVDEVLNPGALEPGNYALVIRGVNQDSTLEKGNVSSFPFRLEMQK